ncbi:MAG: hypothetical protein WC819_01970 [Parcubacteria group bacterium]|jgi:hypothetical protein
MRRYINVSVAVVMMIFLSGCDSPQITSVESHVFKSLLFIGPFIGMMSWCIFLMNKHIVREDGRTDERRCSIVGIIVFPVFFVGAFGWEFGFNWISMTIAVIGGMIIGWFSYTLDELMLNFWEERRTMIPAICGLLLGGWMCTIMFTHVWLEGDMYVTDTASVKRVIVERYTYHYRDDKDGGSYYEWDYYSHAQRFALGDIYPDLKEDVDYKLGVGELLKKDRIGKTEYYRFIGGYLFSERSQRWKEFRWLLLSNPSLHFMIGKVQRVQSDFYGKPIHNAGEVSDYASLPVVSGSPRLPTERDLPPAMFEFKAVMLGIDFVRMIFTEHEYRSVLYGLLAFLGIFGMVALLVRDLRRPIGIFLACASIAPLLIFLIIAGRTGGLGNIRIGSSDRGGRFGGGGSSGRW